MKTINGKGISINVEFEEVFPDYCYTLEGKCYIYIECDSKLDFLMDRVRYENGKTPLYNSFNGCEIDDNSWYEFQVIVDLDKKTANMVYVDTTMVHNENNEYYIQIDDVLPQVIKELEKRGMTLKDLKNLN